MILFDAIRCHSVPFSAIQCYSVRFLNCSLKAAYFHLFPLATFASFNRLESLRTLHSRLYIEDIVWNTRQARQVDVRQMMYRNEFLCGRMMLHFICPESGWHCLVPRFRRSFPIGLKSYSKSGFQLRFKRINYLMEFNSLNSLRAI